jgi:hypothetical protein
MSGTVHAAHASSPRRERPRSSCGEGKIGVVGTDTIHVREGGSMQAPDVHV